MTFLRQPFSKERSKPIDFTSFVGFSPDKTPPPSSCPLGRFSLELFFENVQSSEFVKALSSDLIEHAFCAICDGASREELKELKALIDKIFVYSFLEILYIDGNERANTFVRRQKDMTVHFDQSFFDKLIDINIEMTDSVDEIFRNMMEPINAQFDHEFYQRIEEFIVKSNALGVAHLLKPFLHFDMFIDSKNWNEAKIASNKTPDLWESRFRSSKLFDEIMLPPFKPNLYPYASFKMTHDIPTLFISLPKLIPALLPTVTCLEVPKNVDVVVIGKNSFSLLYSIDSELFFSNLLETKKLRPHTESVSSLALSDCGKWALSCDILGNITVENIENTKRYFNFQKALSCIVASTFSPKIPHQFVVGCVDGVIYLYSMSKASPQRIFIGHSSGIVSLLIHPNSEYIASSSYDETIRLWSITQGCCVRLFMVSGSIPTSLSLSNSGKALLTTSKNGNISIIDIGSCKIIKTIKSSEYEICNASFISNDQMIICYDKLGNFGFWETNGNYNSQVAFVRIDRLHFLSMCSLESGEVRLVGYSKY